MSDALFENFQSGKRAAEEEGFIVVQGDPEHLLIDLDLDKYPNAEKQYIELATIAEREFGAKEEEWWFSKSGTNKHIVVSLGYELSAAERIALQAALGSDPKRELLAINRLKKGIDEPSLLFRPSTDLPTLDSVTSKHWQKWTHSMRSGFIRYWARKGSASFVCLNCGFPTVYGQAHCEACDTSALNDTDIPF